ncbi:hypothetical protein [Robertmurraya sp. P23]|uniref:hypothetical protein n=1 Tax=Robertmurraya sp. P23 TaxID=3436931 RepID=UPI003D95E34B
MSNDNLFIRVLRKEDFLDLIFEIVNIRTNGYPLHLVRRNAGEPVLLIVHFPAQHIVEEVFKEGDPYVIPVKAMLSGPSRLVFELPNDENNWPLTMETLLNWKNYKPVVPKLPDSPLPDSLPDPKIFEGKTALEIPTGLYLSPDESGVWYNVIRPEGHDGRFVLWHTQLGDKKKENENSYREGGTTHIITKSNRSIPFADENRSLTENHLSEIVRLTTDFTLPNFPGGMSEDAWKDKLKSLHIPLKYIPSPINIRRLMLSSAGAWANFEGIWNYPTVFDTTLGYPLFGLEGWHHIITQGRDQFVKTVTKAFLCDTGHAVSIITITERRFEPYVIPNGQNVKGANAVLRKYSFIEVREPEKNYEILAPAYLHDRREMPFKWIKITTTTTPHIENASLIESFWPKVKVQDREELFRFKMVAEDWDGNIVSFERPLMCIPINKDKRISWKNVVIDYNITPSDLRRAQLNHQSIAYAKTENDSKGKTTLETETVTFRAQLVEGVKEDVLNQLAYYNPRFLPQIESAGVYIPAAEQLTGRKFDKTIVEFDRDSYLKHGFNQEFNKGEVFVQLVKKLDLSLPTEKAGGLVTPNTSIGGLSRALGPVANPEEISKGKYNPAGLLENARFLGGIKLKDILKEVSFDPLKIKEIESTLTPDQLIQKLNDPNFKLEAPMLTNRRLPNNAIETRLLWKPEIKDFTLGIFSFLTLKGKTNFPNDAQLSINVQMVTAPNGSPPTYIIIGTLREFALDFAKAMMLRLSTLRFTAENGKKMDISAEGLDLVFNGPLKFVETLKNIIPPNGFSDPPFVDVTASGVIAGFTLGIPSFGVGIFSIENINLSAALSLPFVDQPAGVRFAFSERQKPFKVSVSGFAGGGFFALALSAKGIEAIEASIEFGGNISINLGVASGGVYVMAGIYFGMTGNEVKLTGYLRCGGNVSVLGLVSVTVEFYMGLTIRDKGNGKVEVWGQASLTVGVKIAFFSKSVSLKVERRFAGAAGDPTFAQIMGPDHPGGYPVEWEKYCMAFA